MIATRTFRLFAGLLLPILIVAACGPKESTPSTPAPEATHIDSEIAVDRLKAFRGPVTIRQFLTALGLCEPSTPAEEVLELIEFHDTESSVNSYSLSGGGGVHFTTSFSTSDESAFEVYGPGILENVVTSFEYSVNGTSYFATITEGKYLTSIL